MTKSNYFQDVVDKIKALHPDMETEFAPYYALLVLAKGAATTPEDVHDAWSAVRFEKRPDNPNLVPFAELTPEIAAYDDLFTETIHRVAAEIGGGAA